MDYFEMAFKQPTAQIFQELDINWMNQGFNIIITIVITLLVQIVMYCISRFVIYICLIAIVAFSAYIAYYCINEGISLNV